MTTRRNMIKAGAGLAAILASGKAPAAFVRSMLAARNGITSAAKGLSSRSYVQDGLVAMWDGIENAGWGVHDANATEWKDLIGSNDMQFVGSKTIQNDGILFGDSGYSISGGYYNLSAFTLEVVGDLRYLGGSVGNDVFSFQRNSVNDSNAGLPLFAGTNNYYSSLPYSAMSTFVGTLASACQSVSSNSFSVYRNGSFVNTASGVNSNYSNLYVMCNSLRTRTQYSKARKFNGVRLYNRAMTAAEIAANYVIDKARFNIA